MSMTHMCFYYYLQQACCVCIFIIISQYNIKSSLSWKRVRLRIISPQVWADPDSSSQEQAKLESDHRECRSVNYLGYHGSAWHSVSTSTRKAINIVTTGPQNRGLFLPQRQSEGPGRRRWHSQEGLSKPPAQRHCCLSASRSTTTSPRFLWNCRSTRPANRKKRN